MPYSIRNIRTDQIKATGLIDYTDGYSGLTMTDAPFGGSLAFTLNTAGDLPTANAAYYKYSYKIQGTAVRNDFDESIYVHFVKTRPGRTPVFPAYKLGPVDMNGMKLDKFRPHEASLKTELADSPESGEDVQ